MKQTITEHTIKQAVALFYDGQQAPPIVAKGEDHTANEIIEIAKQHGVTICDNPALAELLSRLDIGDSIPENLYHAIAQIIAFVYAMQLEMHMED